MTEYDSIEKFEAELALRAENRKHIGERGRCLSCGVPCGHWSRCKPCRVKIYEDNARCDPPAGEHRPSPVSPPLPDLIDDEPDESVVPWE